MKRVRSLLCLLLIPVLLAACSSTPPPVTPALRQELAQHMLAARAAERQGRWLSAIAKWQSAQQTAQLLDDWAAQGTARLSQAQLQMRIEGYAAAAKLLVELQPNTLYPEEQQAMAALLRARLSLLGAGGDAALELARAEAYCRSHACSWQAAITNLHARLHLRAAEPVQALALAQDLAAHAELAPAERSHALRTAAEALLLLGRLAEARSSLLAALAIDRELAEPRWLQDDYRLLIRIAEAEGDTALATEARLRLGSLCAALPGAACAGS
ncbi:hypothetical protein [Chitinilyticum litopenaei]|uniref:hypothetical protein n=1 Tax=Chitinilyticum litopenaei TaxID=1121276 RepID=UPI0004128017|nr:hypothetical protein [Chitinilyticum litopenaei]